MKKLLWEFEENCGVSVLVILMMMVMEEMNLMALPPLQEMLMMMVVGVVKIPSYCNPPCF